MELHVYGKESDKKTSNDHKIQTQKTKHWATITPLRIGGKLSSS